MSTRSAQRTRHQLGCPGSGGGVVPNFGTNFHSSNMPVIATVVPVPISCEVGPDAAGSARGLRSWATVSADLGTSQDA